MLNYSVRAVLARLQAIENTLIETQYQLNQMLPSVARTTDEHLIYKALHAIEQELDTARGAASRLAIEHGQADLVWKE